MTTNTLFGSKGNNNISCTQICCTQSCVYSEYRMNKEKKECSQPCATQGCEHSFFALPVPICPCFTDVGFFLGRTTAVSASYVFFLLCLGAHFPIGWCAFLFRSSSEGYTVEDNVIYVVTCELICHSLSLVNFQSSIFNFQFLNDGTALLP